MQLIRKKLQEKNKHKIIKAENVMTYLHPLKKKKTNSHNGSCYSYMRDPIFTNDLGVKI